MAIIEDIQKKTYKVNADGRAPEGLGVGDRVVTGGGTYVITGTKEGGGYTSRLEDAGQTTENYTGQYQTVGGGKKTSLWDDDDDEEVSSAPNPGKGAGWDAGDGLQTMIREAQAQTDGYQSPVKPWTDTSYLNPNPTTGETRRGRSIAEGSGNIITDSAGLRWMVQQDGNLLALDNKTDDEIRQLQQKAQDDSYQVTGRVYKVGADGKAPQWLSVGDQVVTAGGTYIITGHKNGGGYTSEVYDPNQTTGTFRGNYNTGTYGSILGEQNGFADDFMGNRESNGAYSGYGGYSTNQQNGKLQFDTTSFTYDGKRVRTAIQDGVAYEVGYQGQLKPLEAGSLVQDASQRYWIVGADGKMIDVTPEDPMNNPVADPTGEIAVLQRMEAMKAGVPEAREAEEMSVQNGALADGGTETVDAATQAQIGQLQNQLAQVQQNAQGMTQEEYRQYRLAQNQLTDQLAQAGLNTTGASEKAQAQLTADYIEGANGAQLGLRDAETDIAYQIRQATLKAQQDAEDAARKERLEKAETLAQYGDFSGYADLGYTADQIQSMKDAYDRANAPDNSYGGLSSYAQTLLSVYQANPAYDIIGELQAALNGGLINQQDYLAALQTAAGMGA